MAGKGALARSRPASGVARDDTVLPFAVESLNLRGRFVRLGPAVHAIVSHYDYPPPVVRLLGEAAALAALLGSLLESLGRFQLQTRTDGAVDMLVVDYDAPGRLRGLARFDKAKLLAAQAGPALTPAALLGRGHLALTMEREGEASRYQGVVPLEGEGLADAAHRSFRQSEQIPTLVRLAVAESLTRAGRSWRAGGLLLQFLPPAAEIARGGRRTRDLHPGDAPLDALGRVTIGDGPEDDEENDAWIEGLSLAATVDDDELVDPALSSERLLYSLFHEHGVKVFTERQVTERCRCSRERIAAMLRRFSPTERQDMVGDDGKIGVTCEFCCVHREFDPLELE
ncbi:MAG: Hsp33 family molecular chaperone [Methylocystis sp.]|nr:Hsp33 family molecular chaperone [Methylocystis sp.]